ncbi:MAG: two-component system cell cycle sensor histidine kinase/response regulator CckA, partial [Candidatus Binatia bacterium]
NELLENSIGLNAENAEYHGAVTTAANRAADLTRQLLAFSSKQVMHRAAVNLDDLIRASTRMMHRTLGEDIDIVESLGARGVLVDSDQGMLSQVVLNLAVNARDAMPRGGKLSVATKVVELRPDNLPEHPDARDGEFVRVTISDTGSGMDSETLSHIFEPFYTTKETGKGTGLGLSTVFGIVKQHQGWISVASRVGEGSQFEIFLPLAGRAVEEKTKAVRPDAALRGPETILLVEDDASVRNITSLTLSRHGYVVVEAFNAVEARGIWSERGAGIDLLLTDMVMPGGVSGWELVQGLQRENPKLKSVYFSGYSVDALDHGEDLFDGFNFLAKPFQTKELLKTIRARLDDKRPETAAALT